MTARERFEQEQLDKEKKAPEEEDHQEDVSYEVNYMYLRLIGGSTIFFGVCYYMHTRIMKLREERRERFAGRASVYKDPEDPETLKKMTEQEVAYAEPGGEWLLRDLKGKRFGSHNLRGHYYLLFFGHTLSPDVTPLTVMKMTNACKRIKRSKESQYISCKPVFVTVSPDTDSPKHLTNFSEMYDPQAGLILLREASNQSENLQRMLRSYKVPIHFSPEEVEKINAYFDAAYQKDKKWYQFWKKKKNYR